MLLCIEYLNVWLLLVQLLSVKSFGSPLHIKPIKPKGGGICSHRSSNAVGGLTFIPLTVQAVLMSEAQLNPQYFLKIGNCQYYRMNMNDAGKLFLTWLDILFVHLYKCILLNPLLGKCFAHTMKIGRIVNGDSKKMQVAQKAASQIDGRNMPTQNCERFKFVWN